MLGDFNQTKSIQTNGLLQDLIQALQLVYRDVHANTTFGQTAPSLAYQTFFKDAKNRNYIGEIFARISRGDSVYEPTFPPQQWQSYTATGGPIILSVTRRGQFLADPDGPLVDVFDWCKANPYFTGGVPWSRKSPTPFIFLCPFFYEAQPPSIYGDLPPEPPAAGKPASNCLTVLRRTNTFAKRTPPDMPAGFELTQYRMWILLELFARLYRTADLSRVGNDVPDVNHCLRLSAEEALDNAASYSYYAASMSTPPHLLSPNKYPNLTLQPGIHGNCASFPRLRHGGELLETSPSPADLDDPFDFGPLSASTPLIKVLNVTRIQFGGEGAKPVNVTATAGRVPPVQNQRCEAGKCDTYCICD
ncbi:MAG: hypothetical protein LQ350_003256 [Teloschistes chrysophthalmus]|nr:MAG: hypothetical protein LQ350_003256 [Niorma chrysophthalma]